MKIINYKPVVSTILILFLSTSVFAQKDEGWFKRKYNDMLARFNAYFHAKEIVLKSFNELEKGHKDDFTQVIDLFPYGSKEDGVGMETEMQRVMKKCSKVIQNRPESKWEDNCFFEIGKSHFIKRDFYAAIEAFQYVYNRYPESEVRFDAKLWILKSTVMQEKYNDAEALLSILLKDEDKPSRIDKDLHKTAADLFIKQQKYQQALEQLNIVVPELKRKNEKYRVYFVLGQVHTILGNWKEAEHNYYLVMKNNPPYEYAFHGNLGLVTAAVRSGKTDLSSTRKNFQRMLKDDKNIEYFDRIYFELAKIEQIEGNQKEAIKYFQKSARQEKGNKDQRANSYLELAKIFFAKKDYGKAQSYFDSTAMFISEEHPDFERIKLQQTVLTELIDKLVTVETQDSLLRLSLMSKEGLSAHIDDIIAQKKRAEEKKKEEEERQELFKQQDPNLNNNTNIANNTNSYQGWYFANPSAIGRGFTEFQSKWGNRKKTDYWRIKTLAAKQMQENASQNQIDDNQEETSETADTYSGENDPEKAQLLENIAEDKKQYYRDIPLTDQAKQVAHTKIQNALVEAGLIYQKDLKDCKAANASYNDVLERYQQFDRKPEVYFQKGKCADDNNERAEAQEFYDKVLNNYPNSVFADVIRKMRNPQIEMDTDESDEIEELYKGMYFAYKQGRYDSAMQLKINADKKFNGNNLQVKFDYLYAQCVGESDTLGAYLEELAFIVDNYPNTIYAEKAQYTIDFYSRKEQNEEENIARYTFSNDAKFYYLILTYDQNNTQLSQSMGALNRAKYASRNYRTKSIVIGKSKAILIETFEKIDRVENYHAELVKNPEFFADNGIKDKDLCYISEENFKLLLKNPEVFEYIRFFNKNYIQ